MVATLPLNLDSAPQAKTEPAETIALVTGASGGIGQALVDRLLRDANVGLLFAACRAPENATALKERAARDSRLQLLQLDTTDADSIRCATETIAAAGRLDLVLNTVGVLHTPDGMQPEKRLADIDFDDLLLAFDVNALSMMRLAIALEPLLKKSARPQFVSLSARVGSIEDNRLGGWYAYRASKAALNMLLRTLAIEWARSMPDVTCVALHPGTVATDLSAPFTKNRRGDVFSPELAAEHLLNTLNGLTPEDNGGFFAWDGQEIPW